MPKPRLGAASCPPRRRVGSSGALVALKFLAGRLELDLDKKLPLSEHVNYLKAGKKTPNVQVSLSLKCVSALPSFIFTVKKKQHFKFTFFITLFFFLLC